MKLHRHYWLHYSPSKVWSQFQKQGGDLQHQATLKKISFKTKTRSELSPFTFLNTFFLWCRGMRPLTFHSSESTYTSDGSWNFWLENRNTVHFINWYWLGPYQAVLPVVQFSCWWNTAVLIIDVTVTGTGSWPTMRVALHRKWVRRLTSTTNFRFRSPYYSVHIRCTHAGRSKITLGRRSARVRRAFDLA